MITRITIEEKEVQLHWKSRVEKVMEYVEEHLSEDLSLGTVSRNLNYNKSTLKHIFKKHLQVSYHAYVERKRMDKAFQLLSEGKWIKEVMPETGYRNHSTFNKAFKKRFKYPPGYFRK